MNHTKYSYSTTITDQIGDLIENLSGVYAERSRSNAWGRPRDPNNWSYNIGMAFGGAGEGITMRGYTMHEHLEMFSLINMNGRLYDPVLGRMLSPDNYIQAPDNTQSYNRYSYCVNNPLKYTDPSGEIFFTAATLIAAPFTGGASLAFLPAAIGADLGMWQGGSLANGTMNPFKWDYGSGKTWGYMAGGAVVGAASGGAANAIATSGMVGANTAAIITGSFISSAGTNMYTGGQTDVSISFGFGSYNLNTGEFNGIWNWRSNGTMENIGYSLGAFANMSDIWAVAKGVYVDGANVGDKELLTENHPVGHNASGNIGSSKECLDINWGPERHGVPFASDGVNNYDFDRFGKWNVSRLKIRNLRLDKYYDVVKDINKQQILKRNYNLFFRSCSTQVSRAYNAAGVFNIPLMHPMLLEAQMIIRNNPQLSYMFH